MTIQDQIDQIEKDILGMYKEIEVEIEEIKQKLRNSTKLTDSKPTRYYPNGAYMDEPEEGTEVYYVDAVSYNPPVVANYTWSKGCKVDGLFDQNNFPTKEAAEKELNRQKLTAKMYRDMRDERINGDWVPERKDRMMFYSPYMNPEKNITCVHTSFPYYPHDFYYKNETFIQDLKKFLNWTEEELKIVWFRV